VEISWAAVSGVMRLFGKYDRERMLMGIGSPIAAVSSGQMILYISFLIQIVPFTTKAHR
jgi:hypothetical protein